MFWGRAPVDAHRFENLGVNLAMEKLSGYLTLCVTVNKARSFFAVYSVFKIIIGPFT
jgi:hypothetical protein